MRWQFDSGILALAAGALLSACEPVHAPPPGYEHACYGGSYQRTYQDSVGLVTMQVDAPEAEWPKLRELLAEFGRAQHLEVFDTSLTLEDVHYFAVSLCHQDGLFSFASKQRWLKGSGYDPSPHGVDIRVFAYARPEHWRRIARALADHLQQNWPRAVAISWLPEPAPASRSTAE